MEFFEGSVFEDEELVRILPFLALPDGAHLVCTVTYSCLYGLCDVSDRAAKTTATSILCHRVQSPPQSLAFRALHFNRSSKLLVTLCCSCNRQIASADLLARDEDVTRSMVQKAVVVLAVKPVFGAIRWVDIFSVITAIYRRADVNL